ncbi:MAG TPA: hypothetical protein VFW95_06095 [Candidatus Limnocylindria bacterium]|nr:hypothetical protein [Candidatus Limnocylindria bacterium]
MQTDSDGVRVVFDNLPYLVVVADDGTLERAYGPYAPGTEPNLADAVAASEVTDPDLLSTLEALLPLSPALPSSESTLAGG